MAAAVLNSSERPGAVRPRSLSPALPDLTSRVEDFADLRDTGVAALTAAILNHETSQLLSPKLKLLQAIVREGLAAWNQSARHTDYGWRDSAEDIVRLATLPSAKVICVYGSDRGNEQYLVGYGIILMDRENFPDKDKIPWDFIKCRYPETSVTRPIRVAIPNRLKQSGSSKGEAGGSEGEGELWQNHPHFNEIRRQIHGHFRRLSAGKVEVVKIACDHPAGIKSAVKEGFVGTGVRTEDLGYGFEWYLRDNREPALPSFRKESPNSYQNFANLLCSHSTDLGPVLVVGRATDAPEFALRIHESGGDIPPQIFTLIDGEARPSPFKERDRLCLGSGLTQSHQAINTPFVQASEDVWCEITNGRWKTIVLLHPLVGPNHSPWGDVNWHQQVTQAAQVLGNGGRIMAFCFRNFTPDSFPDLTLVAGLTAKIDESGAFRQCFLFEKRAVKG